MEMVNEQVLGEFQGRARRVDQGAEAAALDGPVHVVAYASEGFASSVDQLPRLRNAGGILGRLDRAAETIVEMAQPLPETLQSWGRERGMCPLCGEGSDSYYEQGFKLPEGLRRHLVGYGNTHQCVFTETAHKLALDDWRERFHETEENERLERENKKQQRRSTETTYQIDPFGPPKLIDEDVCSRDKARTTEQMLFARKRLEDLGLEKRFESNVETWVDERATWIVYEDARQPGRIDFTVWKKPLPKRRPVNSYKYRIHSFYLPDSWKNDLKKKYEARLPRDA